MYKQVRIDKLLSNMGYGTRKDIEAFVRAGEITIQGKTPAKASEKTPLDPAITNTIRISGVEIDPLPGFAIMLNKPVGVTCSTKDPGQIIYDLLPARWSMRDPVLAPIGRLDKDTSGLILLTDDGQLNHRVSTPKSDTPKRYHVTLDRPLSGKEADVFTSGTLMLESETKPLLPAEMEVLGPKECILTLHEGRYHQVRRMFASQGNHVKALHRFSIGGLTLPDDLPAGEYQLLSQEQIDMIFAS